MATPLMHQDRTSGSRARAAPFRRDEAARQPCWWDWSAVVLVAAIMLLISVYILG